MKILLTTFTAIGLMSTAAQASERETLLGIVQSLYDAINERDGEAFAAPFAEGAMLRSIREEDGETIISASPAAERAAALPNNTANMKEIARGSTVMIDGNIATVWAPYTFLLEDEFHHCGVNVVTFLAASDDWKIVDLTYSMTTECAEDGFPAQG